MCIGKSKERLFELLYPGIYTDLWGVNTLIWGVVKKISFVIQMLYSMSMAWNLHKFSFPECSESCSSHSVCWWLLLLFYTVMPKDYFLPGPPCTHWSLNKYCGQIDKTWTVYPQWFTFFFFFHTHTLYFIFTRDRLTPSIVHGWPQQKQQWLQLPNMKHTHTMS